MQLSGVLFLHATLQKSFIAGPKLLGLLIKHISLLYLDVKSEISVVFKSDPFSL